MIEATACWGFGPDILVEIDDREIVKQGFLAYVYDQEKVRYGSFCLTLEEAKKFVANLQSAIQRVEQMEVQCAEDMKRFDIEQNHKGEK